MTYDTQQRDDTTEAVLPDTDEASDEIRDEIRDEAGDVDVAVVDEARFNEVPAMPPDASADVSATPPGASAGVSARPPDASAFGARWQDIQLRFVDDPRGAADEAEQLVSEAVEWFSATLASRKRELDAWSQSGDASVEQMLTAVREYRGLLDRLLGFHKA